MDQQLSIGIDIGGTNTRFGLVNTNGNILHRGTISTKKYNAIETFIDDLYKAILSAVEKLGGIIQIKGIGIGAPNGNYYNGTIEYPPNLPWKGVIPMAKVISEKFNLPTTLTNDANAAAMGEMIYGAAKGMRDFIMITLGTGVGSGIVANGQLIYGHDGFAGELGHTIVIPEGRLHWTTGLKGSLEAYASATGVVLTAKEFLQNQKDKASILRDINEDELTAKVIDDAAMKGDEIAINVYNYTGKILGQALANFVMFSNPEAIILFGGLTKAGNLILQPIKKSMEKNLLPVFRNKVKLMFSKLNNSDAAILGASSLVYT